MKYLAIACAALFSLLIDAHSQTILTRYQFPGGSATPTTTSADVDASNVTLGRDSSYAVGFSGAGNIYFSGAPNGSSYPNAGWPTSSLDAVSNQYYATFTVGATTGNSMDLSSFSLNYGGATYSNDGTGIAPFTVNVELRSSIDNFASAIGQATPFKVEAFSPSTHTPAAYSFDLSGIGAMQSTTEDVTFRIYVWASNFTGTPANVNSIRLDNFVLNGSVHAIPEASSLAFLFGGFLSLGIALYRKGRLHC